MTLVSTPLLDALFHKGRSVQSRKGDMLDDSSESTQLKHLTSGYIKRYSIDSNGAESIQVIYGPGDIFPLTPVYEHLYGMQLHQTVGAFHYQAVTDTAYESISQTQLQAAITDNPEVYSDLLKVAGRRLSSNIQRLENISLKTIHRRTAHMLVHIAERFGVATEQGIEILLPLTHQTLADCLSVSRETVTRRVSRLEEKGLLISGKQTTITDIDALRDEIH